MAPVQVPIISCYNTTNKRQLHVQTSNVYYIKAQVYKYDLNTNDTYLYTITTITHRPVF
jgi:hypothetical protein